jgi:hypothetical protein
MKCWDRVALNWQSKPSMATQDRKPWLTNSTLSRLSVSEHIDDRKLKGKLLETFQAPIQASNYTTSWNFYDVMILQWRQETSITSWYIHDVMMPQWRHDISVNAHGKLQFIKSMQKLKALNGIQNTEFHERLHHLNHDVISLFVFKSTWNPLVSVNIIDIPWHKEGSSDQAFIILKLTKGRFFWSKTVQTTCIKSTL